MDMAFLRRAERMLADQPARIDHAILVAALAAQREANGRAAVRASVAATLEAGRGEEPMVELLLGGPSWRQALWAQRGCFSRAEAGRRVNVP